VGKDRNFYGTTSLGGGLASSGTVFRFVTNGTLTTLGSFKGTNGANPQCQLVIQNHNEWCADDVVQFSFHGW
jgi:uncharacterized repeat protein (TIGR03803 family)